ncbi:MAG TPA: hypothetical protein VF846_06420 [Thermoanaerobaculia bacterium]
MLLLVFLTLACSTVTPPAPATPAAPAAAPKVDEQVLGAIKQLEEALVQQPTNTPWIYILATYYDRARDTENVVKWLTRLDELGWEHGVSRFEFRNSNSTAFRDIVAKLEAREPRVNHARRAFTMANQRTLIPEGITHDPVDDVFYVTSIYHRKVVKVDRQGRTTDFTNEAQHGMLAGLGTHVDAQRRLLWVASATAPEMVGHAPEHQGRSALFAFDLRNGNVVKKIEEGSAEQPSFLNDFTILPDGTLLITDTTRNQVFRLAPDANALEVWADDFRFPNGIVAAGEHVYVGDFRGITRVSLADKSKQRIEPAAGVLLNGIDGLALHGNALIAIQNVLGKARVVRVGADSNRVELLEVKNPAFELPTTGVVIGDELWFIANPGLRSFDEGKIWPREKLADPIMLRLPLAPAR